MAGRPTDYSDELAAEICERLATGESLRAMCRDDDLLPCERTVYRWLLSNEAFCQKYTRARDFQSEPHLEDMLEIADNPTLDPADKRVRIDTRKWAMSKLSAKKYGDKQLIGSDPDNPLPASKVTIDMSRLSSDALREIASLEPDA